MRSLKKNQQVLRYARFLEKAPIYERDSGGNIIYDLIDGEAVPRPIAEAAGYSEPVTFFANIAMNGGEAEAKEYGVNESDYEAVITTTDKTMPIDELTRIWHLSDVGVDENGMVDGTTADYSVLAVRPSKNSVKYLLKRITKQVS